LLIDSGATHLGTASVRQEAIAQVPQQLLVRYLPFLGRAPAAASLLALEAIEATPFPHGKLFSVDPLRELSDAVVLLDRRLSCKRIKLGFDSFQAIEDFDV